MSKDNETFQKVLDGLKRGKTPSQAEREEAQRRLEQGKRQAKAQQARDERVKKLRQRKRGGGDDVVDTGMFG